MVSTNRPSFASDSLVARFYGYCFLVPRKFRNSFTELMNFIAFTLLTRGVISTYVGALLYVSCIVVRSVSIWGSTSSVT